MKSVVQIFKLYTAQQARRFSLVLFDEYIGCVQKGPIWGSQVQSMKIRRRETHAVFITAFQWSFVASVWWIDWMIQVQAFQQQVHAAVFHIKSPFKQSSPLRTKLYISGDLVLIVQYNNQIYSPLPPTCYLHPSPSMYTLDHSLHLPTL